MARYNRNRFRGTTIFTEDYLELESKKVGPLDSIAAVLHRVLNDLKWEILRLGQVVALRDQTIIQLRGLVIVREAVNVARGGRAKGSWR